MKNKVDFIKKRADLLCAAHRTESAADLAAALNAAGLRTEGGLPFAGGRGTYGLIRQSYRRIEAEYGTPAAGPIADAFTKPDGTYAYDRGV